MRAWLSPERAASLFWHLMFLNMLLLTIRYGGVSAKSCLIHGILLLLGILLQMRCAVRRLPNLFWVAVVAVLAVAAVQLVPLPPGLFKLLAPVKLDLIERARFVYGDLPMDTRIALMPTAHVIMTTGLILDMVFVALLLRAPKVVRAVPVFWIVLLTVITASLALANMRGLIPEESILTQLRGTYGGVVNQNHYGFMAVILSFYCATHGLLQFWKRRYLEAVVVLLIALLSLAAVMNLYSRAVLLLLAGGGLVWFVGYNLNALRRFKIKQLLPMAVLLIIAGSYLYQSEAVLKIRQVGFDSSDRVQFYSLALSHLAEGQVLGLGHGAMVTAIEPLLPRHRQVITYYLHNEYLQVLLELGPVGFAALLLVIGLFLRPLRDVFKEAFAERERRLELTMLIAVIAVAAAHSLIDFPLRITSVRILFLLLVTTTLMRLGAPQLPVAEPKRRLWASYALLFLVGVSIGNHISYLEKMPPASERRQDAHYYHLYKKPYEAEMAVVRAGLNRLIWENVPLEQADGEIQVLLSRLEQLACDWPLSVRYMNQRFLLEVMQDRFNNPTYREADFLRFEEIALRIQVMGQNDGFRNNLPRHFLYALYLDHLTPERRAVYDSFTHFNLNRFFLEDPTDPRRYMQ